ncbi:MAG: hypothetical protein COT74_08445 [Bdellovibrionales bacterium CG10_big_fil_rev_8_21_14_0_10_45_34]|nr:MAG: hypothetical protein COT74_08445 [Bdellovibrionales bacterium CG10_big_fil_rev_8_21_14_0_10_45_34]
MEVAPYIWFLFLGSILILLFLDLFVLHSKDKPLSFKQAILWTIFWMILALSFNGGIWHYLGSEAALTFFTGYVVELSLSVDNLFLFLLIFGYFKVPPQYQQKVLFLGILGAIVFRIIFIFAGIALIERFHWIIYVFGGFLVITGIKMAFQSEEQISLDNNRAIRLFKKIMPVSTQYDNGHFFTRINGKLAATPLFLCLLIIETTDIIFAADSIPAILAITQEPFIVFTSNVFAILGLRALYFALSGLADVFEYLKYGLAVILTYVGIKMLISSYYKIPTPVSLGVIAGVLAASVLLSIYNDRRSSSK